MIQSPPKLSIKKNPLFKSALTALATSGLLTFFSPPTVQAEMTDSPKMVVDEVWQIVNNEFVDRNFNQVNWQNKREELLKANYSSKKQAYRAINQALKQLNDPYTRFLPPEQFEVLTGQTSGEVSGVGIRIAIDPRTQDLYIIDVIKKSPAVEAGLKRGDRIVRIDGKPTALMNLEQASEALKGELKSVVRIEISRERKPAFEVKVTRSQIEVPSVDFSLKKEGELNVGYIKLDEFSSLAAQQMKEAIDELKEKKASAFVLDLRGNPGGLLFASVDIARMWMAEGEIVDVVDRRGGHRRFQANNSAITDLPLVVLVNGNSASASEILTGALKENKRATIVGTTTYGKGLVQSVHSLSDGSGLAVTISRYYPPSGININKKGITPDVVQNISKEQEFLLTQNPSLLATKDDPQYSKAVTVLKMRSSIPPKNSVNPVSILQ
ncbi:MAG: PDZ domain-containing protein [Cyanobacteria bacterium]|nr:PDZ domain-containing protein [Cyanobacteria bacterium CG_2015-16_32_12]NCO76846.1 PDZ domain-containing protein [Cyanobacteria bacterium CG_2015-22_32_23]NCQ03572.1 PDZ domain-containing protein [Cyanobacteria bacterium CG_2015-09_32_10]NCS84688.1 PDZ domain-containing protein [Cyanobacteria bacterium CG_2015-02_32_10]